MLEEPGHEKGRRMAAEIGGKIPNLELCRVWVLIAHKLKCGGLEIFCKGARDAHLQGCARAHAEDRERVRWLAAVLRQKAEYLGLLGFDSLPVADLAPLMMEPDANGETFWIEPGG